MYRVPGPIQFDGPTADEPSYTVSIPTAEELLHQSEPFIHVGVRLTVAGVGVAERVERVVSLKGRKESLLIRCAQSRGLVVKSFGCLSSLQRERLAYRPPVPPLCLDPRARARPMKQVLCKDPYTQRQVLMHYPYLSNSTLFYLHEVENDKNAAPANFGLRVGFVLLSRQSPGVLNVLWGLHERLKMIKGKCLAFLGLRGLINKEFIEVTDQLLELFLNQGGCELTGRSTRHSLGSKANQEAVRRSCEELMLDGLVMPGSAFAMSESALLAEYFLARQCRTSIIGVPATGSNNLAGEFIETCVGFDSSTKVYAALIGNVLTDAASMPKYWHFVRLMGRQPSFEVCFCQIPSI